MPGRRGCWDLAAIAQWREARHELQTQRIGDPALLKAMRRRVTADADRAERRNRREAGELVDLDAVRRLVVQHVNEARAIFEQVPGQVLAVVGARTAKPTRQRIERQTRKIVEDVCSVLARAAASLPDQEPHEPASSDV